MYVPDTHCDMAFSLQDERTPLMCASGAGHVECMHALLDKGAQVNILNKVSVVPTQTNMSFAENVRVLCV